MIQNSNVSVTDKAEAVRIGEANEEAVIKQFLEILWSKRPDAGYRFYKNGQFGSLDYIIADNDKVKMFVEAKIRKENKFKFTMIGAMKEAAALEIAKQFGFSEKVCCYFLVYFQDTKELFLIDLLTPPAYRKWEERRDRGAVDFYSYYDLTKAKVIYRGDL